MSDVKEALAEAKARWKRVAAGHLVRKDELEAIIAGGGAGAEAAAAELVSVEAELQTALGELEAIDGLAARAPADEARALAASIEGDPFIQSHEERALDSARAHIKDLDAQVHLSTELDGDLDPTAPAPPKPPSREDADAQARAEFERLRAKSKKTL